MSCVSPHLLQRANILYRAAELFGVGGVGSSMPSFSCMTARIVRCFDHSVKDKERGNPSIGNRMINARAETLMELPSFKPLVERRRCIIPADGFYEWRKEGKRKVPMWVHLKNKERFRSRECAETYGVFGIPGFRSSITIVLQSQMGS
jgi:SOS response associated peptidase (SRAP)